MPALLLPVEVEAVYCDFRTCEFTTVTKRDQPWPAIPSDRLVRAVKESQKG